MRKFQLFAFFCHCMDVGGNGEDLARRFAVVASPSSYIPPWKQPVELNPVVGKKTRFSPVGWRCYFFMYVCLCAVIWGGGGVRSFDMQQCSVTAQLAIKRETARKKRQNPFFSLHDHVYLVPEKCTITSSPTQKNGMVVMSNRFSW